MKMSSRWAFLCILGGVVNVACAQGIDSKPVVSWKKYSMLFGTNFVYNSIGANCEFKQGGGKVVPMQVNTLDACTVKCLAEGEKCTHANFNNTEKSCTLLGGHVTRKMASPASADQCCVIVKVLVPLEWKRTKKTHMLWTNGCLYKETSDAKLLKTTPDRCALECRRHLKEACTHFSYIPATKTCVLMSGPVPKIERTNNEDARCGHSY
mmetsp:Transcript_1687/g.2570  ORF Transcript_1687/g.2570 Transcript_1687/m.2570 type:complete len:209 (+) Transcript_1687:108-734(+)